MRRDLGQRSSWRRGVWLGSGGPDGRDATEPDIDLIDHPPSEEAGAAILLAIAYARVQWADHVELRHLVLSLHERVESAAGCSLRSLGLRLSSVERSLVDAVADAGGRAGVDGRPGWMPFSWPLRRALRHARATVATGMIDTCALVEGIVATDEGPDLLVAAGVSPRQLMIETRMRRNAGAP